ncbi:MAG: hypothetical protein J6R34_05220 [Clostridia bacterium]|nr:hypothetical protein [Clostridia bacterium]MBO5982879.1 hypothetical protein [Clostridia bacterium]MBO7326026.1 hypothetical protein [Clostridia bacterium]
MADEMKIVLEALRKLTGTNDIYMVIEAEEIIAELPYQMTKLQLSATIRDLRDRGLIKVKYSSPDEYCLLTVKSKGTSVVQDRKDTAVEVAPVASVAPVAAQKVKPISSRKMFWMSFLGAFLGGGLIMSIAIILLELVFK